MQAADEFWSSRGLYVPAGHDTHVVGPVEYDPGGQNGISHITGKMEEHWMSFHSPTIFAFVDTHCSIPHQLFGSPALNLQYVMHDPPVLTPLKKGIRNVEFSAHWNWLELLLYGSKRVPAVQ